MSDPWLSIIGLNEDSAASLSPASHTALEMADVVFGGPRHLALADVGSRGRPWPIPFSVAPVLACKGQRVAVLASGDPFWFGAGGSLSEHLDPAEYQSFPAPSTFALAASHLGWRLEDVACLGLHAAPLERLRYVLSPKGRIICLLRDGNAPKELAEWLCKQEANQTEMWIMEALGGPSQRVRQTQAGEFDLSDVGAPVAVALSLPVGVGMSRASGLPDYLFSHDGQITKRSVRALTLSALAPRPNEVLWDIGAGSGSISVEWCLAGGHAVAFEQKSERVQNITRNADDFGIAHRLSVVQGDAGRALSEQPLPDAVFVGGGGSATLFSRLFDLLPQGTRLIANGVTLETEALLSQLHAQKGGDLLRIELAQARPLAGMRGWQPARPIVQWNARL